MQKTPVYVLCLWHLELLKINKSNKAKHPQFRRFLLLLTVLVLVLVSTLHCTYGIRTINKSVFSASSLQLVWRALTLNNTCGNIYNDLKRKIAYIFAQHSDVHVGNSAKAIPSSIGGL